MRVGGVIGRGAEITGAILGVLATSVAVWAWRFPPEPQDVRLGVRVAALPSPEFAFVPTEVIRTDLVPGERAHGTMEIRNQTGRNMKVRLRATPSVPDIGQTLALSLAADGATLGKGRLDGLKRWMEKAVLVGPGDTEAIDISASLIRARDGSYHGLGQSVVVSIEARGIAL